MNPILLNFSGFKIASYQNRDNGFPIIFIHGNSLSSSTFINQFNDPILNKFRLITFDLPGHGKSFRSENPEQDYSPTTFIKILIEICTRLNAENGILVGHSLGGHIAINALDYLPNIRGLVTFGTTPLTSPPMFEKAFLPNPTLGLIFKPDLSEEESKQMASSFVKSGIKTPDEIIQSIKIADPLIRLYVGKALTGGNTLDEVKIITNRKIPYAVFHGKNDQLVNGSYFEILPMDSLWRNEVHLIENAGHTPQLENPKLFNELLTKFIDELF
ncbi:MAG: alpha/beta fold hydrolase [Tenuifilaceae bacterium]